MMREGLWEGSRCRKPYRWTIFSPELACLRRRREPTMPTIANASGVVVETPVIVLTLLLGLSTWGLYRLAVSLKEPS